MCSRNIGCWWFVNVVSRIIVGGILIKIHYVFPYYCYTQRYASSNSVVEIVSYDGKCV